MMPNVLFVGTGLLLVVAGLAWWRAIPALNSRAYSLMARLDRSNRLHPPNASLARFSRASGTVLLLIFGVLTVQAGIRY